MKQALYTFKARIDWQLIGRLSELDRFDGYWAAIEKKQAERLQHLRTVATIESVGASTRIEGSKLTDEQVKRLLSNLEISRLTDRDSQEVAGYSEALNTILESYDAIYLTESSIRSLHNNLLRYSEKDVWHRGNYKQHSNAVEASFPDGSKIVVFRTTEPGFPTEDAMRNLVQWYSEDNRVPVLIKIATFIYEFLSIHPFQDGNGRLSRLLTTLLLMKTNYNWVQYVSFEYEIENNKSEYYRVLQHCQSQRPNEDISVWIDFFLKCLLNIKRKLTEKMSVTKTDLGLNNQELAVFTLIDQQPGIKTGELVRETGKSETTIRRIVKTLISKKLIRREGKGRGVYFMPL